MDITVSVTGSRNLSASTLIARNLYSTLQVGTTKYQGSPIEVQNVIFLAVNSVGHLVITLKNSQTETVMYVRNVPLTLVTEAPQRLFDGWLELYPPGDSRNFTFDEVAPRPDVPAVCICLRCSTPVQAAPEPPRASWTAGSPAPSARPSWMPGQAESGLRRTYEQMEDIKSKVSAMTDGKRQVESAEYQLQVVQKELEEARSGIEQAELEVYRLKNARASLEQEKQEAEDSCSRARETLRQHEQSILELRFSCEEAENKLAQVFSECSQQQSAMDTTASHFDRAMKEMAEELQRWRAEASSLSGALEACERRARELPSPGGGELDLTQACGPDEGEDMKALRSQLDATRADLELVRTSAKEQACKLDVAEEECQSAVARLADAEAAAANAREDSRQRDAELRAQADAAERELIACMSRVAALEGQIGENQNQLREMNGHVEELVVRVQQSTDTLRDTGAAVISLRQSFEAHELDITRKALDEDAQDLDSQLNALRERQEQLRNEVASADGEAKAFEDEERQLSREAEEEMQKAEDETDRRERKRLELVDELSALEDELVQARREFCEADEEAAVARAAAATAQAEAEQRELDMEELVEALRTELEEQRREVQALDASQQSSALELDETTCLLPQKRAEAERLRLQRAADQQERLRLHAAADEVGERLAEQDAKVKQISQRVAEQQERLELAKEEARSVEEKETEWQRSLDATASQRREHERAQREFVEMQSQREKDAQSMNALRSRRSQLKAEMAEVDEACAKAASRLEEVQQNAVTAESADMERLHALEVNQENCIAQRAEMDREGGKLEEQLEALEAQLEEELREQNMLDDTLAVHRAEVASVSQEVHLCDEELEARRKSMPAQTEALSEIRERTAVLEGRTECLRSELSTAEASERRARGLRAECDALAAAGGAGAAAGESPELEGLERRNSGLLAEKNAELDNQIERIDELERDILSFTGKIEEGVDFNTQLEEQLSSNDRELLEAMERTADQRVKCVILKQEAARVQEEIREKQSQEDPGNDGAASPYGDEDVAADQRTVDLIKEQLACRTEAIEMAKAEHKEVKAIVEGLEVELQQLQEEQGALADKLSYQVELGSLQSTTIQRLEEENQKLEGEAEVLTLGLHDAEQRNEFLQKENQLMRQQLEGGYNGSLHDWAAEVNRLKGDGEVQRSKDELDHWMQVAQEAERELQRDVDALHRQHEEAEQVLQETLKTLEGELATLQDKLKESAVQKDQKSGGAVHSVPAALHGFVQPVRPPPPNVRRRALIVGCNYARSHAPLRGCANDAWNMQCLLRHSLRYTDDQVRTLIDGSESCPVPDRRQPTKANIFAGLQWLTADVRPGDNLLVYFAGYGTQQPRINSPGSFEAHIVPCDFADDLPKDFFSRQADSRTPSTPSGGGYRLVPLAEVSRAAAGLPAGCKVTMLFDCCHGLPPGLDAQRPAPLAFPHVSLDEAEDALQEPVCSQARLLDLPPLPGPPSPPLPGPPVCCCHCYSACQNEQWCVELLIEGCVQGAFTWAFVKSLTAGHIDTNVQRHCKALDRILSDLQTKFGWIDQMPVLQLSAAAKHEDLVLVPEAPQGHGSLQDEVQAAVAARPN